MANEYQPDYVSSPGETLLETLNTLNITTVEFAKHMACSTQLINDILWGREGITVEIAEQLEKVLLIPAAFWLRYEKEYQEALKRISSEIKQSDSTTE